MTVPEGTATGKVFRISGQGLPRLHERKKRGDLHVRIKVDVPKKLSREEKVLIKDLHKIYKKKNK